MTTIGIVFLALACFAVGAIIGALAMAIILHDEKANEWYELGSDPFRLDGDPPEYGEPEPEEPDVDDSLSECYGCGRTFPSNMAITVGGQEYCREECFKERKPF